MKKVILPSGMALLLSTAAIAQQSANELDVHVGGGLSTLQYSLQSSSYLNSTFGFGGSGGLGYTFFFSNNIGLGFGLDFAAYTAKATIDPGKEFSQGNVKNGYTGPEWRPVENYTLKTTVNSFTEKQQAYYLNIPIHIQYQHALGKKGHMLYGRAGLTLGQPIMANGSISANVDNLDDFGVGNPAHGPKEAGIGDNIPNVSKQDIDMTMSYSALVELGGKWRVSDRLRIYTGLYFEYGFNDARNTATNTDPLVAVPEGGMTDKFALNSALTVPELDVKKVNLLAGGIKVRIAFGVGQRRRLSIERIDTIHIVDTMMKIDTIIREKVLSGTPDARHLTDDEVKAMLKKSNEEGVRRMQQAIAVLQDPIVGYELTSTALSPDAKRQLDEKADILKQYPELTILIEGHTCNIGTPTDNLVLSRERAEAAKKYLVKNYHIAPSRIYTRGRGESEPRYPNTTDENRYRNRRIEVYVSNPKK